MEDKEIKLEDRVKVLEENFKSLQKKISIEDVQPENPKKVLAGKPKKDEKARITNARWESRSFTFDVGIGGFQFCNDGDREDVCSYGVAANGRESEVEFAQRIYSHNQGFIRCKLDHSNSWSRVYVSVRHSSCGDAWSQWFQVE